MAMNYPLTTDRTAVTVTGPALGNNSVFLPRDKEVEEMLKNIKSIQNSSNGLDFSKYVTTPHSIGEAIGKNRIKKNLRYKGLVVPIRLLEETYEFFEDEMNITKEELQVLQVMNKEEYDRFSSAWRDAWTKLQSLKAFED